MTTSKTEPQVTGPGEEAGELDLGAPATSPDGNVQPNTPPGASPTGNVQPNTPPGASPTGNVQPNTPPGTAPTGNVQPNTPPAPAPAGNVQPNTPPPPSPAGNVQPNTPPVFLPTGNVQPNLPPLPVNGQAAAIAVSWPAQPDGVWVQGRVITQLWSSSGYPGVLVFVDGLGWKRLAATESGRGPLTSLALLAKVNGLAVSYHEDAAGQIDQLLV